jgi:hypothetical protein
MEPEFQGNLDYGQLEALLISLPLRDLLSLCSTNPQFNLICQNDNIWRLRFIREFPFYNIMVKPIGMSWKEFYLYEISSNIRIDFYLDKNYIKYYYLPHITPGEHSKDYLEGLKRMILNNSSFSIPPEYLILYDTNGGDYPLAYSTPSLSTYTDDWNIDETILPPPITQIYIYTNPNSIPVTTAGQTILLDLRLEPTFLNELYVNISGIVIPDIFGPAGQPFYSPISQYGYVINLNGYQYAMNMNRKLHWDYEIYMKLKSLL